MKKTTTFSLSLPLWLVFGILGYFVYDGIGGALAVILLSFILGLVGMLGFIPMVGIFLFYFLGKLVMGKIIIFTVITPTWLTSLIFWLNFSLALILSVMVCFMFGYWNTLRNRNLYISPFKSSLVKYCKAKFSRKEDVDKCVKGFK